MSTLPRAFVDRVLRDLGREEGEALCAALGTPPPVSVRLNPAKCGAGMTSCGTETPASQGTGAVFDADCPAGSVPAKEDPATVCANPVGASGAAVRSESPNPGQRERDATDDLLRRLGAGERIPWSEAGWYLAARPSFTLDSDFHAGAYYVQEPASQFVGHLLRGLPLAGARILDLCAAPGGKTTLYASLAGPDGLVVANEIDRHRAQVLADNVRKWGTGNVAVTICEPQRLGDFEAWFDAVAVDAPCSGEGMFRKDPGACSEWSESNVMQCAARQDGILREAWRALKPGGILLYSTCTFNRAENEGTLERMTEHSGDEMAEADEVPVEDCWGVVCGRVGAWRTYRFYPHRARGEGFFAAVVRKAPDAGGRMRTPKAARSLFAAVDGKTIAELARWVLQPDRMRFAAIAGTLYGWNAAQVESVRTLSGALPVIYSGVAMGQLFQGRLKPDPALALFAGLNRCAAPVAELDEEEALDYLRKQTVGIEPFAEGLNIVCARGRALGFAKRIGGRVNNRYPDSLRIVMK